jgi:hypothetical protein
MSECGGRIQSVNSVGPFVGVKVTKRCRKILKSRNGHALYYPLAEARRSETSGSLGKAYIDMFRCWVEAKGKGGGDSCSRRRIVDMAAVVFSGRYFLH